MPKEPPPSVVWVLDALYRNGAVHLTVQLARHFAPRGCLAVVQRLNPNDEVQVSAPELKLSGSAQGGTAFLLPSVQRPFAWPDLPARPMSWSTALRIGAGFILSWLAARLTRKPLVVAVHADLNAALKEWILTGAERTGSSTGCIGTSLVPFVYHRT